MKNILKIKQRINNDIERFYGSRTFSELNEIDTAVIRYLEELLFFINQLPDETIPEGATLGWEDIMRIVLLNKKLEKSLSDDPAEYPEWAFKPQGKYEEILKRFYEEKE